MRLFADRSRMIAPEHALPGRAEAMPVPERHEVLGTPLKPPFPEGLQEIVLGMGCFWGGEEIFWQVPGVYTTAVGYAGGHTPNPSYEEVCSGSTGHAEVVLVVFDPGEVGLHELLVTFFEMHDPTQGYRQGNDVGTQYRSAIYYSDESQRAEAERAAATYSAHLQAQGYDAVTTEIAPLRDFFYAEPYHQQYLHKVPNGYRCHASTGIPFPAAA
ncbi:MAG TPA: peptide-methionine (S)-S-oxide reductase MsrA [Solirubrobacteraceae bacterium]|jgi:peptide-methionine (S)-S-oxide reductase|nr:peptide-methionine (S)-S-oxide reductase MsrA [Solirubrobacteraceae bacterium]